MRKFLFAVLLMLLIVFIIGRAAELGSIVETLKRGDLRFFILALIVETGWLFASAAQWRAVYHALGIEEKIQTLVFMFGAANFTNIVAPSAGVSGLAIFIAEAKRRNYSQARAMVAGALFLLFDYLGFLCILFLGLIILIRRNDLSWAEITGTVILVLLASLVAFLLYQGMHSADALGQALGKMARVVNRILRPFIRREYLSESRAYSFAHDAAEGLSAYKDSPRQMLIPIGWAVLNKSMMALILGLMFMAFKVPISIGTVIAGYSIGYLFLIVSPTPAGIGFVEGALTLTLNSMYIPLQDAAVIVISYRAITFWIPLLFGMISFRILEHIGDNKNSQTA